MIVPPDLPAPVFAAIAASGVGQAFAGWVSARRFLGVPDPTSARPPITVLKPLHGDEAMLEAALAGFCAQDYPQWQLVCGVGSADDAAAGVVERVRARFPQAEIVLVVDPTWHGPNRKIGNLINMLPAARHELLVISDSDMHVAPDYLSRIADAFARPGVGLVTSLYVGLPARASIANVLGAAYINQNFASGALVGRRMGREDCLGATMALTRETLRQAGGLSSLAGYVADDAILGRAVRALGRRIVMVRSVPATTVDEAGLAGLFRHELRWARTIRAVEPNLFGMTLLQYPVFWAMLAVLLSGFDSGYLTLLAAIVALRAIAGRGMERTLGAAPTPLWLGPLRDTLSVMVGLAAFAGRRVAWRGEELSTEPDRRLLHPRGASVAMRTAPPELVAGGD